MVTFFNPPTRRPGSSSTMRSSRRKGNRWGSNCMISRAVNMDLSPPWVIPFFQALHAAEEFRELRKQGRHPEPDRMRHRRNPRPDTRFGDAQGIGNPALRPQQDAVLDLEMARETRLPPDHDAAADPHAPGDSGLRRDHRVASDDHVVSDLAEIVQLRA